MPGNIFINYRRDDSSGVAGRLHDRMAQAFGSHKLFMDVDNIPVGVDFEEHLKSQVAACDAMVAVIGPNWVDARDETGLRRLDNPDDFVTIEIAAALGRKIPVIPVLLDGPRMPRASELPDSLKPLAKRQAFGVRHAHFGQDAEFLIAKMKITLGQGSARRGWWRLGRRDLVAAVVVIVVVPALLGLIGFSWRWTNQFATPTPFIGSPTETVIALQDKDPDVAVNTGKTDGQRLAFKAAEDQKAKAAAEAEEKRKADEEAEQRRLAALRAEEAPASADQERQAEQQRSAVIKTEPKIAARPAVTDSGEKTHQGWIGIRITAITNEIAGTLRVRGVQVTGLDDNGPAKSGGIEPGDVIIKFDGHEINEVRDLPRILADTPVGKDVQVIIIRKGAQYTKTVKVSVLPTETSFNNRGADFERKGDYNRAIAQYSEAIRLNPKNVRAFCNRGRAKLKNSDRGGNADIAQAYQLDPKFVCDLVWAPN